MKNSQTPRGRYSRGYLPHIDDGISPQFITMRLFDSLPQKILQKWKAELALIEDGEMLCRKRIEKYLDIGYGECFLKDTRIAGIVQDSLLFYHLKKYELISWVIMPNHTHFLYKLFENVDLETLMHSIKSFTAHEANKVLGRTGKFWQFESFDRYIRNSRHFRSVIGYIEKNPVKAGLCRKPEDWEFGSAFYWRNV